MTILTLPRCLTVALLGVALVAGCADVERPGEDVGRSSGQSLCLARAGKSLCFVDVGGLAVTQGDIVLGKVEDLVRGGDSALATREFDLGGDVSPTAAFHVGRNGKWGRSVPYTIRGGLSAKAVDGIRVAIQNVSSRTGIAFVERSTEADYLVFQPTAPGEQGCYAYVGRIGGGQGVYIDPNNGSCSAHEIGHALGLVHEQSRPDRDAYVTVHYENVLGGLEYNFDKDPEARVATGYDYASVMHYTSKSFSKNGRPTITLKDGSTKAIDTFRTQLSDGDVVAIQNANGAGPVGAAPRYEVLVGDFTGDGLPDVATVSKDALGSWANWLSMEIAGVGSATWNAATPTHMRNGGTGATYTSVVGDFNGDGKADIATISPNAGGGWADWASLELSTGSGFASASWPTATTQHMRNGGPNADYRVLAADFNGDGKTDLATITRDAGGAWSDWIAMEFSTGAGFRSTVWTASTPRHMRNGGSGADYRVLTGDFNGDGRADIATITKNAGGAWSDWVAIEFATTEGFASGVWTTPTPMHMRNGGTNSDYEVFVGDFDGDRRSDLLTISKNAGGGWADWASVDLSTGRGFASTPWVTATPRHMRNGGVDKTYKILSGDLNGDGKTDLATVSPNGGGAWSDWISVDLSTGQGFSSGVWTAPLPRHMRNGGPDADYRVLLADFTGDKKADLLTLSPNAGGAWESWMVGDVSTGQGFTEGTANFSTPVHMRNGTPR